MLEQILRHFPAQVHALTLVSDPDNVLAEETALAHLNERGFSLLVEADPVQLRREVTQFGQWSAQRPLILVTPRPLNQLAYDWWQQGQHVTLALHTFLPTLAYPVAQALTPNQRRQLGQLPLPAHPLGRTGSMDFCLRHLFGVRWQTLSTAAGLIAWLNRYHQGEPMPALLAKRWLSKTQPHHPGWPLADWLAKREAFEAFISQAWRQFITAQTDKRLKEAKAVYQLSFGDDERLQDTLPQLARSGVLRPVTLAEAAPLPAWAQVGVRTSAVDLAQQRAEALLATLAEQMIDAAEARWEQWQAIATTWAELTAWRHHRQRYLTAAQRAAYGQWRAQLDAHFAAWLGRRYAPLAGQGLPRPHHVFHALHWLAYERRRQGPPGRVALLVLDGLSLAAWTVVARAWRERHPAWQMAETLVLAQVPSLTAVSRQALVSGERPANFAATIGHNRQEGRQWTNFWAREDMTAAACAYEHLSLKAERPLEGLSSGRTQALCLINNSIDEMVHGATQGLTGVYASLHTWLHGEEGARLEGALATLLEQGYRVYLASDHGHTEAWGMGQAAEGLTVQTRSQRGRLYRDRNAALAVQADFPQTVLWPDQRILPAGMWALLAGTGEDGRRLAFAPPGERVVTHGGATLDEVVVPLVRLSRV